MARNLTQSEISAYRDDGVVHVANAIDPKWLELIDGVVEQQLNRPGDWANDGNPGELSNRLFTDRYLWKSNDAVREFVFNSACARLAGQAMRSSQARFYFDHLIIKEPLTPAVTPWHQDVPYWPFKGDQICSVWVALTDATVADSAMEFVRGSHLDKQYYMPEQFGARKNHPATWTLEGEGVPVPPIEECRSDFDIVSWDVKRGDAMIFSAWLLHGAPGNQSLSKRRAAISTRWLGDSAVWYPHKGADPTVQADDVKVAPGESPNDDTWFPCVWRAVND